MKGSYGWRTCAVRHEFRLGVEPQLSVTLPMGIVISIDEMFRSGGNSSPRSLLDMLRPVISISKILPILLVVQCTYLTFALLENGD
ncbi:hypothetical protein E2562_029886 [Oryza meyeriana var. granulata]|uniref:Uncharacterized protein n=1 Tax=Oryza meyeriana var. granulata TaxID=110450 RepID=A0A6G1CTJ2_9ORYZ|nr:hypothetical protein E2562_029886 [Oryza meyeriana var. granulata]